MTPIDPESLASELATLRAEQATTSKLCTGLVKGQNTQGILLERLVVTLEAQEERRTEQRERCSSHGKRLRDLEMEQASMADLPDEVSCLRNDFFKSKIVAGVLTAITMGGVLLAKLFSTGKGP